VAGEVGVTVGPGLDHPGRVLKFFVPFTRPSHRPSGWYGGDDDDDVVVPTSDGWRFAHRTCTERWRLASGDGPFPEGRDTF